MHNFNRDVFLFDTSVDHNNALRINAVDNVKNAMRIDLQVGTSILRYAISPVQSSYITFGYLHSSDFYYKINKHHQMYENNNKLSFTIQNFVIILRFKRSVGYVHTARWIYTSIGNHGNC